MHKYRSWTEINLKRFSENIQAIKSFLASGTSYLQIVKADAYGHGAVQCARIGLKNGAKMLGVANMEEALQLRLVDINAPILLMGPAVESEILKIVKYNLTPSISDFQLAKKLSDYARQVGKPVKVHIEVDTGMGRTGIFCDRAVGAIKKIGELPNLILEGIFSHFPISEVPENEFCYGQIEKFKKVLQDLENLGIHFPIRHMANSGGIVNYPEAHFDMVRPGIMTFGEYPGDKLRGKICVKPVMSFKTQISQIKILPKGSSVSYGQTFFTDRETKIAVLPVGYGDGYDILLSNKGEVLIGGKRCPIIGRVTMDLTMVDVTGLQELEVGDEVVIIGEQGNEKIDADDVAARTGKINYEILCAVGRRAPRIYVHETIQEVAPIKQRKNVLDNLLSNSELDEVIADLLKVRLNEEIGTAVYHGILEAVFGRDVEQMEFRENFRHEIIFEDLDEKYYKVRAKAIYRKKLRSSQFTIACATNSEKLNQLFEQSNCEYRWLIEEEKTLTKEDFEVTKVKINGLELRDFEEKFEEDSYILVCSHEKLSDLVGQEVEFNLETRTKHPKSKRSFPVYIVQPTKGLKVRFRYDKVNIENVEMTSFFAGKEKYPKKESVKGFLSVEIPGGEWIFPNSGIIFVW